MFTGRHKRKVGLYCMEMIDDCGRRAELARRASPRPPTPSPPCTKAGEKFESIVLQFCFSSQLVLVDLFTLLVLFYTSCAVR